MRLTNIDPYIGQRIKIKAHQPASWYTSTGASKKLSALQGKGLPSFKDWRFITLTLDPKKFASAESGYHYAKDRMRFFFRRLRNELGLSDLRFIWKLEFQKNGWVHWHCLVDYKKLLPHQIVLDCWGLGFVNVKRMEQRSCRYIFKYVAKGNADIPAWFLKQSRPRVLQSSGVFPSSVKGTVVTLNVKSSLQGVTSPLDCVAPCKTVESLGERLDRWNKTMILYIDDAIIGSVEFFDNWWDVLADWVKQKTERIHYFDSVTFEVSWSMLQQKIRE